MFTTYFGENFARPKFPIRVFCFKKDKQRKDKIKGTIESKHNKMNKQISQNIHKHQI